MMARSLGAPSIGRIQKRTTNFSKSIIFGLQRAAGPYRRAKCRRSFRLANEPSWRLALNRLENDDPTIPYHLFTMWHGEDWANAMHARSSTKSTGLGERCCGRSLVIAASSVLMDQYRSRRDRRSNAAKWARRFRPFNELSFARASDVASSCGQTLPMYFAVQLNQQLDC